MKKSLSLLLALAMVFGMFASMASAADSDLTTEQKYQQLVDKGVLKGTTDGLPHLDKNLTRAEFATIAVAIAGLTPATGTTSAFSDVNSTQWWFGAIQAAADAGLVNGTGNGKFTPKANVTVQEVIKVATTIAKLTPVEGAKVEGSADWAGPFIQAAIDAGLPISSNYKAAATRGQTIDVAYAVFASLQVKPLSDVKAVLNANDTITVTGKTVGADAVKVAIGTGAEVAATLKEDGTFTYTTAAQAAGTVEVKVTAYKGTTALASTTASVTIDGFKVESATVLNGKQIAIKFNKAVQEGIAQYGHKYADLSYYQLNGKKPASVDLSDDKTTVTLTFLVSDFPLDTYAQLLVKDLHSASGKSLSEYKNSIYLADTTAPTVTGVTYSGYTATITFSEPVATIGTLSVNGYQQNAFPAGVSYSAPADAQGHISKVVVTLPALATDYSFALINITDIAGNRADYTTTLNIPSDNTAPTVASATISGTTLTVKYSEGISNGAQSFVKASTKTTVYGAPDANDNTVVKYNLSTWLGGTFETVTLTVSGFKDLVNLQGADYTTTVTLTKDTTAPTVESVFLSGTKVVIKFSEDILTYPNTLGYSHTSSINVLTTGTATGGAHFDANNNGVSDDDNYVAYELGTVKNGKYSFDILGNTFGDTASPQLFAAKQSLALNTTGASATGSVKVGVYTNTTPKTGSNDANLSNSEIRFEFDEAITPASLNLANFLINGVALPSGTGLVFKVDQKNVIATLPADYTTYSGDRKVTVANIVAESGNTLSSQNGNIVFINENVAPVAKTVSVNSDNTIVVSFSETLKNNPNAGTVEVYINNNKEAISGAIVSNNTVVITVANGKLSQTSAVEVKFVGTNVTDLKGNAVADSSIKK